MAVAADYMNGNTHIIIRDDYCVKTEEEIDAVLDRVSEIYVRNFTNQAMATMNTEIKKVNQNSSDIENKQNHA